MATALGSVRDMRILREPAVYLVGRQLVDEAALDRGRVQSARVAGEVWPRICPQPDTPPIQLSDDIRGSACCARRRRVGASAGAT